ncbi:Zinc finger, GRF-type [Sesbania bispinosa]|nr:Zinc finger, GRF-type [Sesbania bispinosa]
MRSSSSSSHPRRMLCKCGEEVLLLTSTTVANPGKTFWRFPRWNSGAGCNFFRWCEEEVQNAGNHEVQKRYELEIADLELKVSKLKRKLHEERVFRRLITVVLIVSWAMIIGLCIFFSVNCVRA